MGLGGNFRKGQVLRTSSCGGQPLDEFDYRPGVRERKGTRESKGFCFDSIRCARPNRGTAAHSRCHGFANQSTG